jgi:hypothetical protein
MSAAKSKFYSLTNNLNLENYNDSELELISILLQEPE